MDREAAIVRLIDVFRQYGYDGATMSRLSEATGLGKSSLYHHFPGGKEEMATAVLEHLQQSLKTAILEPLQSEGAPVDRLCAMNKSVAQFYNHGRKACLLALLLVGDAKDLFNVQVGQALNTWIDGIAQVAIAAGIEPKLARQRAEDAILQIQGAIILSRGLGDNAPFERVLQRIPNALLSPDQALVER
jgi:TetR/AcrR family transcriptional regulator, lmrAB and yxaGH operons repressor